jgi:hypothetical protein
MLGRASAVVHSTDGLCRCAPKPFAPAAPAPAAAGNDGPGAADLLENRLEQLRSLLWCRRGEGIEWAAGEAPTHLDNMRWIAADLVSEARAWFERCAGEGDAKA